MYWTNNKTLFSLLGNSDKLSTLIRGKCRRGTPKKRCGCRSKGATAPWPLRYTTGPDRWYYADIFHVK